MTDPDYEALRTAFTASVSHELRTPLARLQALLETAELPGADLQGLLRQAQDEVVEMTELVDDVLFLSELEQGREVVALGDTEAAPVLRAVVDELTERAELSGLGLQLRIEDETIHVPLRRRMLRLVVENLLENALRYAGEGATCTITLAREDGNVLLEVADDGTGVPDADVRAAVRALLPLRPGAHHARHRAGAGDRQARDRVRRRERRSPRRAGPRARRSLRASGLT